MGVQKKVATGLTLATLACIAILGLLVGFVFIMLGIFWLLVPLVGYGYAGLIVGAGIIGLILTTGLLIFLLKRIMDRRQQETEAAASTTDNFIEEQLRPIMGHEALEWTKSHRGWVIGGAVSVGFILAVSPRTRRVLLDAATPLLSRKTLEIIQSLTDRA